MVTQTYLKPTYLPNYVAVVTVVTIVTALTLETLVTVVTVLTIVTKNELKKKTFFFVKNILRKERDKKLHKTSHKFVDEIKN